jgi:hypothetical protein
MTAAAKWLETEWVLAAFGERLKEAQTAYRWFVAVGKNQPSPWEELKHQIDLGSKPFVDEMQRQLSGNRRLSEVSETRRRLVARLLAWYFQQYPERNSAVLFLN